MKSSCLFSVLQFLLCGIQGSQANQTIERPRVATIQLIRGTSLQEATALVKQAGEDQADIVLLPMEFAPLTGCGR